MKKLLLIAAYTFIQYVCFAQPVISSFMPQASLPQSQLTIAGNGFSNINDSNVVYFGAVKAVVNSSSANSLVVTVPVGASYAPLTVTSGGLTGYSQLAFNPVTNIAISEFDSTSFEAPFIIATANTDTKRTIHISDIDNDGKADIVSADSNSILISIIKNISQKGVINSLSFANEFNISDQFNWGQFLVNPTDVDGDGKKDFISNGRGIKIFKNNSTLNNIQLTATPAIHDYLNGLTIADFDGDGKPDMAGGEWRCCSSSSIRVLKNTTPVYSNISFDTLPILQETNTFNQFYPFETADINGDGKPDMIYGLHYAVDSIFIRVNTSNSSSISFSERTSLSATAPYKIIVRDMDGDNKNDIVCMSEGGKIILFRNTNIGADVSFAPGIELLTDNRNMDAVISDFDGDGKPDIACSVNVGYTSQSHAALFKNNSTPGNLSFYNAVKFKIKNTNGIAAGDIDGDGKQDIIIGCEDSQGKIAVFRNKMGESALAYCPPATNPDTIIFRTNLSGTNYRWQVSTDSVNFSNITNNFNFVGATTANLALIDNLHLWHGRQFRCMVDGRYDKIYIVSFKNTWTGAIDSTWENTGNWSCNALPDTLTDVAIPANSNVVLGSNGICRSIKLSPSATFQVLPGFSLSVTH